MIDKERSRQEFLAAFRKNVEEAEKLIAASPTVHVLVNHDCTLAICQANDGETLRFGGVTSGTVTKFRAYKGAVATAHGWNKRLTDEQQKAGCIVRVMEYEDALKAYAQMNRDLITQLETLGK